MRRRLPLLLTVALAALVVPVGLPSTAVAAEGATIVLNGESDRLNGYDAATGKKQRVIPSSGDDKVNGRDINAELCFIPKALPYVPDNETWFIAGEDTEQNVVPGVIKQGWGIFRLSGDRIGNLSAKQLGKLVPQSFVTDSDNPENYGCGILPDGRLITGDVGDQLPQDPATGQLIVWFPNASHFGGPDAKGDFAKVPHCKIDVQIGTAGGIHVDGTDVYIASNRPSVEGQRPGGVYRYDSTVWPTMGPGGTITGCGRKDSTGAPLADEDRVGRSLFIPQSPLLVTPSDIVDSGKNSYYVSSVFTGHVAEFDRSGMFKRYVLQPPAGLPVGQIAGITPFGIGVAPDGTLWVADIGVQGDGPAQGQGSVVRVRFDEQGNPGEPETIDEGLEFPDGIGIVTLTAAAAPAAPTTPDAPAAPPEPDAPPARPAATSGGLADTGPGPWPAIAALLAVAGAVVRRRVTRPQ